MAEVRGAVPFLKNPIFAFPIHFHQKQPQRMTELTWEGKYKNGKKNAPVRIALPFQTIETVNESRQLGKQGMADMFAVQANQQAQADGWYNRLIWGDKKYVLPSLLPEFAGKVNLIYIDPPFDTGANFSFTANIPQHLPDDENGEAGAAASFTKQPSVIEQKAYRDTWGRGLDSYLQWFYETAVLLRELLAEDGSIYVHLDWHVGHYAKVVLDEVFGYENFRNEIVWQRTTNTGSSKGMANKLSTDTDVVLYYTKSSAAIFNKKFRPYSEEYLARFKYEDKRGKYRWQYMATYSDNKLAELKKKNMIRWKDGSAKPEYKQYIETLKGIPLNNLWTDIYHVNPMALEKVSYNTQKPEALLQRIIEMSSNENDLILDCFCGSGTTAAVAEKLGRRWITCDLGRFAIHTARKRLLGIPGVKPFTVQNLGKYERQQWVKAELGNGEDSSSAAEGGQGKAALEQQYRRFILDLYHARPLEGHVWLHGAKAGRLVHVGGVDAPVSEGDVKAAVLEFWKISGKEAGAKTNGIDILGWEFAFELHEAAEQFAAANKVNLKFKKIPREVLERKAVEQGDIRFFELAFLGVDLKVTKRQKGEVTLRLENFVMPPDEVPEDVQRNITHWSQWIDYWAVDWNYHDDTFHNEWQSYRTKQNPKLILETKHTYEEAGRYQVVVKVIDILGNDTTKLLTVEI